ncbi:MAG: tRNA (guanosine(37)-N1)-methyltransferase TrmD [Pseudomonadota bacterium]
MSTPPRSHGTKSIRASARPRDLMAEQSPVGAWRARVVTLFPEAFPGILGLSLTGAALEAGLWSLEVTNLRDFGLTKHRNVDAPPAGGGAGLVLRPDVVGAALEAARGPGPILYLSPRGRPFDQARARALAAGPGATLLCGRFEGVDQRVLDHFAVEEISLGDFVLTGGEIAAQALLDATIRLLPGVVGNAASLEEESFANGLLEHPHYTKPADWQGRTIPPVLTSGDHGKVAAWRREEAEALTRARRPDLWAKRND